MCVCVCVEREKDRCFCASEDGELTEIKASPLGTLECDLNVTRQESVSIPPELSACVKPFI